MSRIERGVDFRAWLVFFFLIGLALFFAFLLLLTTDPARAHSFYTATCCSGRDCAEVPPGTVKWTPDGWLVSPIIKLSNGMVLTKPETVPFNDKRIKLVPLEAGEQGAQSFHICVNEVGKLLCVYKPEGGL